MSKIESHSRLLLEINTQSFGYTTRQFTYEALLSILRDGIIGPDDYLEFITSDGLRAAVRKKDIVSIDEVVE